MKINAQLRKQTSICVDSIDFWCLSFDLTKNQHVTIMAKKNSLVIPWKTPDFNSLSVILLMIRLYERFDDYIHVLEEACEEYEESLEIIQDFFYTYSVSL